MHLKCGGCETLFWKVKLLFFKAQLISKMVMKIKNKNRNNKKCFGPNKLKIKERNFIF